MTALAQGEALHFVHGPSEANWDLLGRDLAIDPVMFEVLRHKLEAINEEQAIALKAVSSSPIVTEASDFNIGLYLPNGDLVSMGSEIIVHASTMPGAIRHVIAECSENPGIGESDMFAVNDPYKGAPHHPDLSLVAPIHYAGELVAWSGAIAHQVDVGGMTVGSISAKAREKYQEGLMMPPIKLVERGVMREDVWRLILNMTRQPQMVGLDLKGFVAANVIARRRLIELIELYGLETVKTVMLELIRYSERRFRERLLELPDGEFRSRGFLDHDGHENRVYRTDIVLTKRGDTVRFDFSGSSPQAPGFINCTEAMLAGAVLGGLAPLLVHGIPWNQGIMNAIEIVAPEGLVCNARPPAPTGMATIGEGWVIINTIVHAASKLLALSERYRHNSQAVTNGGFDALFLGDRNQHGEPFGTQVMDAQLGGGGARATGDGIDQSGGFPSIRPRIPNVESNELHGPMLYLYRSFFPDSGGDGTYRGGRAAGLAFTPYGVERLRCALAAHGIEVPISPGLFGGYPGTCNRHLVIRGTELFSLFERGESPLRPDSPAAPLDLGRLGGSAELLPAKTDEFLLVPGDVFEYRWAGGGGYGDPLGRDPRRVAADVELGTISARKTETVYGVMLREGVVDSQATEELRARLRHERLARATQLVQAPEGVRGQRVAQFGLSLHLSRSNGRLQVECDCGHVLGAAGGSWKGAMASHSLASGERPEGIVLHETLELVEYLCPACGRLHVVEVKERAAALMHDVKLGDDALPNRRFAP